MKDKELLEYCNEFLKYDPETGILTNKINRRNAKKGKEAGCHGRYRRVWINKKVHKVHRVIFLMAYGYLPKYIDHINHDKLDNRIINLRPCTAQENCRNRKAHKNSTSKYKGVCWAGHANKWLAQIYFNERQISIGVFEDEEKAALAYNSSAKEYFGDFAYVNTIKAKDM